MNSPPTLNKRRPVIKVHLVNSGTFRRIAFDKLLQYSTSRTASYDRLVRIVQGYFGMKCGSLTLNPVVPITMSYTDEDGDKVLITSDEELNDAFDQVSDKMLPVVRAFAEFESEKVDQARDKLVAPCLNKRVQVLEDQLRALSNHVRTLTIASKMNGEEKRNAKEPVAVETAPEDKATATTGKVPEAKSDARSAPASPPPAEDGPKEFNLDCFDPNFIHGRHTCDGCFTTPILGYRFNATNLPDYDLCQKCFKKYKGNDILFQPEQLQRDEHLQHRWQTRRNKHMNRQSQQCGQSLRQIARNTASEHVDKALHEAIRLSLLEEVKRKQAAAQEKDQEKSERSVASPKQVGTQTDIPVAQVDSSSTEVSKSVASKPKDSASVTDLEMEVTAPPLKIECPCVLADPPEEPSFSPNVDGENGSEPGEKILDGDEDEDEAIEMKSQGSWEVVDEDGQISDEMVAQAAQLLGSALFQSDMASGDVHITNESVHSGLTSVPTITSRSEIAPVVLHRWEDELRQLHELGFLDDRANVDALGHFEAANLGVDSDDPININTVVEYLLNMKKEFDA